MSWLSKLGGKSKTAAVGTVAKAEALPPPTIKIDSREYPAADFIPGTFRIRPYEGDLIAKQSFDFRIAFKLNGEDVEVACRGVVARLDDQVGLIARYTAPQPFYERRIADYLKVWQKG
jgi:hypothetical protein